MLEWLEVRLAVGKNKGFLDQNRVEPLNNDRVTSAEIKAVSRGSSVDLDYDNRQPDTGKRALP